MSSKFARQQKRKKWSEDCTRLPQGFLDSVASARDSSGSSEALVTVCNELLRFSEATSSYAELEVMKKLAPLVPSLPEPDFAAAAPWMVEIVFCENSSPLHRQIISAMKKLPEAQTASFERAVESRIRRDSEEGSPESKALAVSIGKLCPAFHAFINQRCAVPAMRALLLELRRILDDVAAGNHIPPSVMTDIQNGLSSLYLLFSSHGAAIAHGLEGDEGVRLMESLSLLLLEALKGTALVRDAMMAASVALWALAAIYLPDMGPSGLAAHISRGLFFPSDASARLPPSPPNVTTVIDSALMRRQQGPSDAAASTFATELRAFSEAGRITAIRGAVAALPMEVLCAAVPLEHQDLSEGEKKRKEEEEATWTMLVDGALEHLVAAASTAPDAHHKFHVLSSLSHVLGRLKSGLPAPPKADSSQASSGAASSSPPSSGPKEEEPSSVLLGPDVASQIFHVLSNCLEEPLSQSVKKVQEAFESLLDIQAAQASHHEALGHPQQAAAASGFVMGCASDLLRLGTFKKGKYAPLAALARRVGALRLLQLDSNLLLSLVQAMQEATVCTSAVTLLDALLQDLCDSEKKQEDPEERAKWRQACDEAVLGALLDGDDTWRTHNCTYALPVLFRSDPGSFSLLLGRIAGPGATSGKSSQKVPAVLAILKAGRGMRLLDDLDTIIAPEAPAAAAGGGGGAEGQQQKEQTMVPLEMLYAGIGHKSDSVRVACMELACTHPRKTSLPGRVDICLIKRGLVLSMRCTSSSTRNKFQAMIAKLMSRIREGVQSVESKRVRRAKDLEILRKKQQKAAAAAAAGGGGGAHEQQQQRLDPAAEAEAKADAEACERVQEFMQWLTQFTVGSLYPGASYERKYMAIDILLEVLKTWKKPDNSDVSSSEHGTTNRTSFDPFCERFFSRSTTQLLLGACVDSWDHMREGAMQALVLLPSPLPGLEDPGEVEQVVRWASRLLESPRVRESDAGARLLRMVAHKYVGELCWQVAVHPSIRIQEAALDPAAGEASWILTGDNGSGYQLRVSASAFFLDSLCDYLEGCVKAAREDLAAQCSRSLAHGILLAMRYLIEDLDWKGIAAAKDGGSSGRMSAVLKRALENVLDAASVALPAISNPKEMGINNNCDDGGEAAADAEDAAAEEDEDVSGHSGQVVQVGCWLTIKEASLLIGTVARKVPLPPAPNEDSGGGSGSSGALVDEETVTAAGNAMVGILVQCKHNGANEKCQLGLQALADALLRSRNPRLSHLPRQWLQRLIARCQEPGQGLDDIVRRSAGLPLAFVSLFTAEPSNMPKVLLSTTMTAIMPIVESAGTHSGDWEPWHKVHSFNVLRAVFQSRDLSTDSSGYFCSGLMASIQAMGDDSWDVRNSAALTFTELITRTLGFKNVLAGDSAKRAVTGLEFFHRYPPLHPFLLSELTKATQQLLLPDEGTEGTPVAASAANKIHPSLYPVLVLLSRLKPSLVSSSAAIEADLSPTAFVSVVQQCACSRLLAVRHLAAQAIAPLVAPGDLQDFLSSLASEFPLRDTTANPSVASVPRHNRLHGSILQMTHVLKANGAAAAAAVSQLQPRLSECAWLGTNPRVPATLRADFLSLLDSSASILRAGAPSAHLEASLATLIAAGWAVTSKSGPGGAIGAKQRGALLPSPSLGIWQKNASKLAYGPTMAAVGQGPYYGFELGPQAIELAFHSPHYEVRAGALKGLLRLSEDPSNASLLQKEWLCRELVALVAREEHHKVLTRALGVLAAIEPPHTLADVEAIQRVLDKARHPGVRLAAQRCLGSILGNAVVAHMGAVEGRQKLDKGDEPLALDAHVCGGLQGLFKALLELAEPTQTYDARLCAAKTLGASRLLMGAAAAAETRDLAWAELILDAWVVAFRLMEDEDDEVREATAAFVRPALARTAADAALLVDAQVELLLREAVKLLTLQLPHVPKLLTLLLGWIDPSLPTADGAAQIATPEETIEAALEVGVGAARRLFDKELDNQHEEPLLLSQIAAEGVTSIISAGGVPAVLMDELLNGWGPEATVQLGAIGPRLLEASSGGNVPWVGGPGNHPEIFRSLYRLMLGLKVAIGANRSAVADFRSNRDDDTHGDTSTDPGGIFAADDLDEDPEEAAEHGIFSRSKSGGREHEQHDISDALMSPRSDAVRTTVPQWARDAALLVASGAADCVAAQLPPQLENIAAGVLRSCLGACEDESEHSMILAALNLLRRQHEIPESYLVTG